MSVLSTMALMMGVALKPREDSVRFMSDQDDRIRDLEARIRQLENAATDDRWITRQCNAQMQLAQMQWAQMAQAQQMAQTPYQQGLLGAQNLQLDPQLWCNCVPSRAQVWAATAPSDDTDEAK